MRSTLFSMKNHGESQPTRFSIVTQRGEAVAAIVVKNAYRKDKSTPR